MPGTGVGTSTLLKSHPFVHVRFPGAWNKCGNLSILSGLHAVSCVASRDGVGALLAGVEGRTFLPRARRKKPSGEPGVSGDFWGSQEGCQGWTRVDASSCPPWSEAEPIGSGLGNGNPLQYSCLENPMDKQA